MAALPRRQTVRLLLPRPAGQLRDARRSVPVVLEAVAAINGPVVARHKRDLRGRAAICADRVIHFALAAGALRLAVGAAVLAADGFVLEPFFRIELLLARGEDELCAAILANQNLVLEHVAFFPFGFLLFFLVSDARLTWSLPPHSPLPGFSGGLTSKIRHDHCRLADQLTWSPSPVAGMAFQSQTRTAFMGCLP